MKTRGEGVEPSLFVLNLLKKRRGGVVPSPFVKLVSKDNKRNIRRTFGAHIDAHCLERRREYTPHLRSTSLLPRVRVLMWCPRLFLVAPPLCSSLAKRGLVGGGGGCQWWLVVGGVVVVVVVMVVVNRGVSTALLLLLTWLRWVT